MRLLGAQRYYLITSWSKGGAECGLKYLAQGKEGRRLGWLAKYLAKGTLGGCTLTPTPPPPPDNLDSHHGIDPSPPCPGRRKPPIFGGLLSQPRSTLSPHPLEPPGGRGGVHARLPGLKPLEGFHQGLFRLAPPLPAGRLEVGHTLRAGGLEALFPGPLKLLPLEGLHQSPGRGGKPAPVWPARPRYRPDSGPPVAVESPSPRLPDLQSLELPEFQTSGVTDSVTYRLPDSVTSGVP